MSNISPVTKAAGNSSDASPANAPARSASAPAAAAVSHTMDASERVPTKRLGDEAGRSLLRMEQVEDEASSEPIATYATTIRHLDFRGFLIDGKHSFGSVEAMCVDLVGQFLGRETGRPGKKRGRSPDPGLVRANKKLARGGAQTPLESDSPGRSILNVVLEDELDRPVPSLETRKIPLVAGITSPKAVSVEAYHEEAIPDQANPDQADPNETPNKANPKEEVTPTTVTRKPGCRTHRPNRGVHPIKCRLSDRCIAFFKNHLSLKHLPPYASEHIPRHELYSNCTAPDVDLRLVDFPVSVEELLTYFPICTRWHSVIVRLFAHNWKGAAIHHYIYWAHGLTQLTSVNITTITSHYDMAQKWFDKNLTESSIKAKPSEFHPQVVRKSNTGLHDYYLVDLAEGVVNHPPRGALALTHAVQHAVQNGHDKVLLSEVRAYVEREKLYDIATLEKTYDARANDMAAKVFHEKITQEYCRLIKNNGKTEEDGNGTADGVEKTE